MSLAAWVFAAAASVSAVFFAHAAWTGRFVWEARTVLDGLGFPAAAMAVYLATNSWRAAIVALALGEAAGRLSWRLPVVMSARAARRTIRTATPSWVNWATTAALLAIALLDIHWALRLLPYVLLGRIIYGFFFAPFDDDSFPVTSRKWVSPRTAILLGPVFLVLATETAYGNLDEIWFLTLIIFRHTGCVLVFAVLMLPILLLDDVEPDRR